LPVPVDDVRRGVVKRGVMLLLVIFVGGHLLILVVGPVVILAFNPPAEAVAWSIPTLLGLGAVVLAVISGRRARADRERAKRDADQTPNGSGRA
jgi:hypothetical protein